MMISSNIIAEKTLEFMEYPNPARRKKMASRFCSKLLMNLVLNRTIGISNDVIVYVKKPRNGSYENSNNGKTKSRPIIVMFRHELLNYVKTKCNHRFVMCHSYNGKIKMKKAGKEKGKWIIVTSPDGLSIYSSNIDEHRD